VFKFIKKILGLNKTDFEEKSLNTNKKRNNDSKTEKNTSLNKGKKSQNNLSQKNKQTKKSRCIKSEKVEKKIVKPLELNEVEVLEGKKRFFDYTLHEDILFGLQKLKFKYCTPIQEMTLDLLLQGKDIAGKAQTGTGKTAAFLISTFNYLLNNPLAEQSKGAPRCLILAPTRELAMQIHKDAEAIGIFTNLNSMVVFGGMDHEKQRMQLDENVDILIGTPGRIIDYSNGASLDLSKVEILILDEADRMLDMGFIPDVRRIIGRTPSKSKRQTMLFSATLDDSILRLADDFLYEAIKLESEPDSLVAETIKQTFFTVSAAEKLPILLYFIKNYEFERMIIFGNRKDIIAALQRNLAKYGVAASLLSGDVPQEKRIKILNRFRNGQDKILIATDVAARGIHVDNVSIVINYDLPERPDDYIHRIGRTGRAGHTGEAISFLCEYGAYNLGAIEDLLNVRFSSILPPEEMLILPEKNNKK
jgi:ATP-dependent RNA helicase RhlB